MRHGATDFPLRRVPRFLGYSRMTVPKARIIKGGDSPTGESAPQRALSPADTIRRLFGGLGVYGWFFAAFGVVFAAGMLPKVKPDFASYDATARGTVVHVERTNDKVNDDPVMRVSYTFEDSAGRSHQGASYTTYPIEPDTGRIVEYERDDPGLSRLDGMDRTPVGDWAWVLSIFVLIFPIVGLALAVPQLVRGIRAVRVVRTGVETTGTIVDVSPTSVVIRNRGPIMRATVEFLVGERPFRTTFDFLEAKAPARDSVQRVVYDPRSPTRATVLDNATENGGSAWADLSAALLLIAPAIFLIGLVSLPFVF
jgi:hypothetical protein